MVFAAHRLLQDNRVYWRFSWFVKSYEKVVHEDGSWEARQVAEPYTKPTDGNMLSWDAAHYDDIRMHLYDKDHSWVGNFAFFPAFPIVWRLTQLGPVGISLVNWMLYVIGLALVALVFGNSLPRWSYVLLLCAPYAVIFMIPYSEALFFLGIAAGMYGLVKDRYWLYFLGFLLACTTRAAGNILVVAWIIVDLLAAIVAKSSFRETMRNMLLHLAPIIIGVLAVMLLQHMCGADHWFEYVVAQKQWGKELSWPTWPFTDWSSEGKSITQPLIFMLFVPALVWLAIEAWNVVACKEPRTIGTMVMLRLISVLFFVGNVLLALFTQHGCLFSQARLLTCTPFFAFLVLDISATVKGRPWRWGMLLAMAATAVICISMFSKPAMLGCWLVFVLAALVFFGVNMNRWLRSTLLVLLVVFDIYWTAYLFNCFLTDGWIFT